MLLALFFIRSDNLWELKKMHEKIEKIYLPPKLADRVLGYPPVIIAVDIEND